MTTSRDPGRLVVAWGGERLSTSRPTTVVVGRGHGADVRLVDERVAPRHASFTATDGAWTLRAEPGCWLYDFDDKVWVSSLVVEMARGRQVCLGDDSGGAYLTAWVEAVGDEPVDGPDAALPSFNEVNEPPPFEPLGRTVPPPDAASDAAPGERTPQAGPADARAAVEVGSGTTDPDAPSGEPAGEAARGPSGADDREPGAGDDPDEGATDAGPGDVVAPPAVGASADLGPETDGEDTEPAPIALGPASPSTVAQRAGGGRDDAGSAPAGGGGTTKVASTAFAGLAGAAPDVEAPDAEAPAVEAGPGAHGAPGGAVEPPGGDGAAPDATAPSPFAGNGAARLPTDPSTVERAGPDTDPVPAVAVDTAPTAGALRTVAASRAGSDALWDTDDLGLGRNDPGLLVHTDGRAQRFEPGAEVLIGASPRCDVTVGGIGVADEHLIVRHDGAGWVLEPTPDGSFSTRIDGAVVSFGMAAEGAFSLELGDPGYGAELHLATAGIHRRRRRPRRSWRGPALVALVGVLLVALVLALWLASRDGGTAPDSDAQVEAITDASMQIRTAGGEVLGTGVLVGDGDFVVTAAHIVSPRAAGRGLALESPLATAATGTVEVLVSPIGDGAPEPASVTRARSVVVDGYLDLAVLELVSAVPDHEPLELTDVPAVPGDAVHAIGLAEGGGELVVERAEVTGVASDPRLGDERANLLVEDVAVGPGTAVTRGGRLVGLVAGTDNGLDVSVDGALVVRPAAVIAPLLQQAGSGRPYESSVLVEPTGAEAAAARWGDPPSQACDSEGASSVSLEDGAGVEIELTSMTPGQHVLVRILRVEDGNEATVFSMPYDWADSDPTDGCLVATLPADRPVQPGRHVAEVRIGTNYETVLATADTQLTN